MFCCHFNSMCEYNNVIILTKCEQSQLNKLSSHPFLRGPFTWQCLIHTPESTNMASCPGQQWMNLMLYSRHNGRVQHHTQDKIKIVIMSIIFLLSSLIPVLPLVKQYRTTISRDGRMNWAKVSTWNSRTAKSWNTRELVMVERFKALLLDLRVLGSIPETIKLLTNNSG